MMPTGAGKSICYLLPSLMLPGLTVVVSPLLSLMRDQMQKLPVELPGACFSGGMTAFEASLLVDSIIKGHVKILFVSPERLCTSSFRRLLSTVQSVVNNRAAMQQHSAADDPYNAYTVVEETTAGAASRRTMSTDSRVRSAVSLLCVDEAHCISQWSYNFRPSFMRIRRELQLYVLERC